MCFQPCCLLIRKACVSVMHVCVSHTLQSALESEQKARTVQSDFSTTFHRINHQGILCNLCSLDIGDSVLSILTQFLLSRSQHVMVDSCRSKLVDFVPGVPQPSVSGPLLFLLFTSELFLIPENKLISFNGRVPEP